MSSAEPPVAACRDATTANAWVIGAATSLRCQHSKRFFSLEGFLRCDLCGNVLLSYKLVVLVTESQGDVVFRSIEALCHDLDNPQNTLCLVSTPDLPAHCCC